MNLRRMEEVKVFHIQAGNHFMQEDYQETMENFTTYVNVLVISWTSAFSIHGERSTSVS